MPYFFIFIYECVVNWLMYLAFVSTIFAVGMGGYVFYGISHQKAFKLMGYKNDWVAWIPFYSFYALADCIPETKGDVNMFGALIPGKVFKFWWVNIYVIGFIPIIVNNFKYEGVRGVIVGLILIYIVFFAVVIMVLCAGFCYTSIYANLEEKSKDKVRVVGYVSALFNIVAVVRFLTYKNKECKRQS